jgi:hypothetical protein
MADADMVKFLEGISAVPIPETSPDRTAKFISGEIAKWAPIIKANGIKVET